MQRERPQAAFVPSAVFLLLGHCVLIQMVNGILSFGRCKLLTVFRSKLVINCAFGHRHIIIILLCLFEGIRIPVYTRHIINSILCSIRREAFTIRGSQLVINTFLRHMKLVCVL